MYELLMPLSVWDLLKLKSIMMNYLQVNRIIFAAISSCPFFMPLDMVFWCSCWTLFHSCQKTATTMAVSTWFLNTWTMIWQAFLIVPVWDLLFLKLRCMESVVYLTLIGFLVTWYFCWQVSMSQCYMKQLLSGLHYCHANEVLHRDIKGTYWMNLPFQLTPFYICSKCVDL